MRVITIAGGLGRDAVYKQTSTSELCSFSVAAEDGFGDNKTTIWFDVTRWGKGADRLAELLTKGKQVTVIGTLSTREHEGKTYLQVRADHVKLQGGSGQRQERAKDQNSARDMADDDLDSDSIPF